MNVEGGLCFHLVHRDKRVIEASLQSARPLAMVKVLQGKPFREGLTLLGMMYRICGVAQRYAGIKAWQHACQVDADENIEKARLLLLSLETMREHLWQILVVWPGVLGESQSHDKELSLLSLLMQEMEHSLFKSDNGFLPNTQLEINERRCKQFLQRLERMLESQVFAMPVEEWLTLNASELVLSWANNNKTPAALMIEYILKRGWQQMGDHNGVTSLPDFEGLDLSNKLQAKDRDDFIAQPKWQERCCETSALSRRREHFIVNAFVEQYGTGILTRMVARLVELAELFKMLKKVLSEITTSGAHRYDDVVSVDVSGQGLATIEAARGRLTHWISIDKGLIRDYAILAPTEWNFHPEGVAMQGLKTLQAESEADLKQQASLWITAIDPCVGYELRIQ